MGLPYFTINPNPNHHSHRMALPYLPVSFVYCVMLLFVNVIMLMLKCFTPKRLSVRLAEWATLVLCIITVEISVRLIRTRLLAE